MANNKSYIKGIIFIICAICFDGFIIFQSCLNASLSSQWSGGFTGAVANLINLIAPNTITNENFGNYANLMRKLIGHFGFFGFSAFLTTFSIYYFADYKNHLDNKFVLLFSLIPGICLAFLTEAIQLKTEGRSGELRDVLIDLSGYIIGFLLVASILYFRNKKLTTKRNQPSI